MIVCIACRTTARGSHYSPCGCALHLLSRRVQSSAIAGFFRFFTFQKRRLHSAVASKQRWLRIVSYASRASDAVCVFVAVAGLSYLVTTSEDDCVRCWRRSLLFCFDTQRVCVFVAVRSADVGSVSLPSTGVARSLPKFFFIRFHFCDIGNAPFYDVR